MTDLMETLSVWSSRPIVQMIVLCSSFSVCGKVGVQYKSSVCSMFFVLNMLFSSRFVNRLLNWVQNRWPVIGKHSSLSNWESEEKKHRYWLKGDLLHPGHMGFQVCMLLKETDILQQSSQSAIQQCAFLVESVPRFSTHLLKCSLCFPHSQMHTLLARWLIVQMLCRSVGYWWVSGYGWLKGDPSRTLSRLERSGEEEEEEEEEEEIGLRKGFAMLVGLVSCSSIIFPACYIFWDWRYG